MKKITIAIAGLGSRGFDTCGKRLAQMGDTAQVVAVAEPRQKRRDEAAALFGLSESGCFETAEEMLKQERLADVMLICTLDDQHEHQAVAALEEMCIRDRPDVANKSLEITNSYGSADNKHTA